MTQNPSKGAPEGQWPPDKHYWLTTFQTMGQNPDWWRLKAATLKKAIIIASSSKEKG
jgi:hypothetical protein